MPPRARVALLPPPPPRDPAPDLSSRAAHPSRPSPQASAPRSPTKLRFAPQALRLLLAAAMLPALAQAQTGGVSVPLMLAPDSERQGFVRIINGTDQADRVRITAVDDAGNAASPTEIDLEAGASVHFNSDDLADGNSAKGIRSIGRPRQGHWRLRVEAAEGVKVMAFVRTRAGFLTAMHDVLPRNGQGRLEAWMLNPGSNRNQESSLRLVNTGTNSERVSIRGVDDRSRSVGPVTLTLPAGQARTITAFDLENGAQGLTGSLGDGGGKWRLTIEAGQAVMGMGLLATPGGPITNISTIGLPPAERGPTSPPPSSTRYGAFATQDQQGFSGWALYWNADSEAAAMRGGRERCDRIEPKPDLGCSAYATNTFQSGQCAAVFTFFDSYFQGTSTGLMVRNSRSEAEAAALNYCTRIDDASECRIAQSADGARASVCISDTRAPSSLLSPAAPTNPPTDPEPPDGEGDSFANAINLAVGGRVSGGIDRGGEADYYRIRASESGTLSVYTTGSLDTIGHLYDSGERQLASNDDGGESLNFRIEREVDAGTYYARVAAYSSSATGSYTVHAELDASTEPEPPTDPEPPEEVFYSAYAVGNPIHRRSRNCSSCWTIINGWNEDFQNDSTQREADQEALADCNNTVWPLYDGPANCRILTQWHSGQCLVVAHESDIRTSEDSYGYVHLWEVVPSDQERAKLRELRSRCAEESQRRDFRSYEHVCFSIGICELSFP